MQTAKEREVRKQGKVAGEEREYTGVKAQDRGQHTLRRKSMGGNTNIKYMDGCTHAHQQTHTNTRTLSNYSSEKPLVSYISRPADESS